LLSEACKIELVDALHDQPYVVNNETFNSVSMRAFEDKRRTGSDGTIAVEFRGEMISRRHVSDLLKVVNDPERGQYHLFSQEMTVEVQITIRSKEQNIESRRVNPRFFSESIMRLVISRVRKYWDRILINYRGSIDYSRGWVNKEITPHLRSEMVSHRFLRFWIRYVDIWSQVEDDEETFGLPTRGVTIDAKSDYNEQDWEYALVLAEV